jgi:hypothetical protein
MTTERGIPRPEQALLGAILVAYYLTSLLVAGHGVAPIGYLLVAGFESWHRSRYGGEADETSRDPIRRAIRPGDEPKSSCAVWCFF